jgi:energy-coupling factor transporter ATP-binding protein EcfA2
MIIELFGPPAAGKTTLARALAVALEKNSSRVQLIESSRPSERASSLIESTRALSLCGTALAAPLSRAAKLVSAAPFLLAGSRTDELTASLMELLPPRTLLRSVRCRRFLSLLCRSWKFASASDGIVIFDQGFVTALCSMAVFARFVDRSIVARALALIPCPNLLIRVDAPRGILEARLHSRLGSLGAIERLFEFDLQTNLRQIETIGEVACMLQKQGRRMMHVSSLDRSLLEEAVDRIVREATSWDERPIRPSIHLSRNDALPEALDAQF